jgi:hypothetical protein
LSCACVYDHNTINSPVIRQVCEEYIVQVMYLLVAWEKLIKKPNTMQSRKQADTLLNTHWEKTNEVHCKLMSEIFWMCCNADINSDILYSSGNCMREDDGHCWLWWLGELPHGRWTYVRHSFFFCFLIKTAFFTHLHENFW